MPDIPFSVVWNRIVAHAGETFHTKTGLEFKYSAKEDYFYPNRTRQKISKKILKRLIKGFRVALRILTTLSRDQHTFGQFFTTQESSPEEPRPAHV